MSTNDPLPPELTALEAALGNLSPVRPGIDREQLWFAAGRLAERTASRRFAAFLAAGVGFAGLAAAVCFAALWLSSQARLNETRAMLARGVPEIQTDTVPPAPDFTTAPAVARELPAYLQLRNVVLTHGVDAIPSPAVLKTDRPPLNSRSWDADT